MRFTRLFTQTLRQQVYDSGCIPADREYLVALRALTERHGSVLIFDEVLSAFRTGPSCAQGYYGIVPDRCAIAKGIANGAPIALVAGRRDLMGLMAPLGPVAHSGTYTDHLFGILAAWPVSGSWSSPAPIRRCSPWRTGCTGG
jgi:glutamate-1-semialdehyde 2,1-aminomutase